MASILDKEMYNYFTQLNEAEKKSVVLMLKTFLRSRKENSGRINIKQYNKELAEAETEFAKGDFISNAAMKARLRNGQKPELS